jgi:hypothetical protein
MFPHHSSKRDTATDSQFDCFQTLLIDLCDIGCAGSGMVEEKSTQEFEDRAAILDALAESMIKGLGIRALDVARSQLELATGESSLTWAALVARLARYSR